MDFTDAIEKLKDNPKLAKSLKEAFRRSAGVEEVAAILDGAGVDASVTEPLVAEYQKRLGSAIADEDLDEGALAQVAGGGGDDELCPDGFMDSGPGWEYDCGQHNKEKECDSILF